MELLQIAKEIKKRIDMLAEGRKLIKMRAENKANAIANYDKALAKKILLLKESGMAVTIIDKVARGECWQEKLDMELADGLYRSAVSGMDSISCELNGLQSLFRHLDNT